MYNLEGTPLSPDQTARMMEVWAKTEALSAEASGSEELCWYLNADGSGGLSVTRVDNTEEAGALSLEIALALGEFLEIESKIVIDKESAMPSIGRAVALISG